MDLCWHVKELIACKTESRETRDYVVLQKLDELDSKYDAKAKEVEAVETDEDAHAKEVTSAPAIPIDVGIRTRAWVLKHTMF